MAFADCQPDLPPLTQAEICNGFSKCGGPGLTVNGTNLNRFFRYLESLAGVEVTPVIFPPESASNSGVEGGSLSVTHGTFTTNIGGAPTLSLQNPAPLGVTFADNGDGTYTLGGSYPAFISGVENLTILAQYPGATDVSIQHVLLISEQPACLTFTPESPVPFTDSGPAGFSFFGVQQGRWTSSSGPVSLSWSESGNPALAGITFTDFGSGRYMLSGAYPSVGEYPYDLTVSSACGSETITGNVLIGVDHVIYSAFSSPGGDPAPFSDSGPAGSVLGPVVHGTWFAAPGGSAPISIAPSGLPIGVTFADNGDGTFSLGGNFPAAGSYSYTIVASNPNGNTNVSTGNLIVATGVVAPTISFTPSHPNSLQITGEEGAAIPVATVRGAFSVSNGDDPTLAFAFVPVGVNLADNGDGTFTVTGTFPTYGGASGGSNGMQVTASYPGATDNVTVCNLVSTEPAAPTISFAASHPNSLAIIGEEGAAIPAATIRGTFSVSNGAIPTLTVGFLDAGIAFADNGDGTFTISGTFPTYGGTVGGNANIQVTASSPGATSVAEFCSLISTEPAANPITLSNSAWGDGCAVTSSPGTASYGYSLLPNGNILAGDQSGPATVIGQWHNGSISAADYEVRYTDLGGGGVSGDPVAGVWSNLGSGWAGSWSLSAPGSRQVSALIEIRRVSDGVIVDTTSGCEFIGVDEICQLCSS